MLDGHAYLTHITIIP